MNGLNEPSDLSFILNKTKELHQEIAVFLAVNVKGVTKHNNDYSAHSIVTEYFTENEIEQIVSAFRQNGIYTDVSTDENEFIGKINAGSLTRLPHKHKIVYSSAQKGIGPGRKSLIPSFCNMSGIQIIGSNAYVRALCRHKYHVYSILKQHGIQKMQAWMFDYKTGWLDSSAPPDNIKVIAKPLYESASIGIDQKSILLTGEHSIDILNDISKTFDQPLILQEFIEGYEVEVPVMNDSTHSFSLGAVGISVGDRLMLGNDILTYDIVYHEKYGFYNFKKFNPDIAAEIEKAAVACARILNIEGLGRVDFRITSSGNFYITDVATNPHIIKHSTCGFLCKEIGFDYSDLPILMLGLAGKKYNWF